MIIPSSLSDESDTDQDKIETYEPSYDCEGEQLVLTNTALCSAASRLTGRLVAMVAAFLSDLVVLVTFIFIPVPAIHLLVIIEAAGSGTNFRFVRYIVQ